MGASESKLAFKKSIFRLSDRAVIAPNDPYWVQFWELPESVEDVFSLFGSNDVRRARDANLKNLETLLHVTILQIFELRRHPSFPEMDFAPARDMLNCIRVLTRILPFIYEAEHLEQWEERFFWAKRRTVLINSNITRRNDDQVIFDEAIEGGGGGGGGGQQQNQDAQRQRPASIPHDDDPHERSKLKPLGEELLDTLIELLFCVGFTVPVPANGNGNKISYSIWESGVGCNTSMSATREMESNRTEVLRLLLTLTSKSMYMSSGVLPVKGVRAITYMATCPDKLLVLSMLCSLLNTSIKYSVSARRLPYDHVIWRDPKQTHIIYCLQLLLVLLLYPIPESTDGPPPKNYYRYYLGRLHRQQDFAFLVDGITKVLQQPIQANSSYLPGSQKPAKWVPEMIMLFWEVLQCNSNFRTYITDSNLIHEFLVLCIFYAMEYRMDPARHGIAKMCVFVLQTLSVEPGFGKHMNEKIKGYSISPARQRLPDLSDSFSSFGDLLIMSIYRLMNTSNGQMNAFTPAFLAIFNNVGPYLEDISFESSSKIISMYLYMSSTRFMLANETNHHLLRSLLEFINSILEHNIHKNPRFLYSLLRARTHFETLHTFTTNHDTEWLRQQRKQSSDSFADRLHGGQRGSQQNSFDYPRRSGSSSLATTQQQPLTQLPEDSTFTIGDDESDEDDDSDAEQTIEVKKVRSRPQLRQQQNEPRRSGSDAGEDMEIPFTQSPSLSQAPSVVSAADSLPQQLRGMSEKARGKMPAGKLTFSRQNSSASMGSHAVGSAPSPGPGGGPGMFPFVPTAAWIDSWAVDLPLHTCLTVISALEPHIPTTFSPPSSSSAPEMPSPSSPEGKTFISNLPSYANTPPIQAMMADASPTRVHLFEWSPLSLGWYESLLWGFIFTSEMLVNNASSGATPGTVGVWNGTAIKLFRVQEAAAQAPSLLAPRGAVDAVGSNLVRRIGSLNITNRTSETSRNYNGDGDVGGGGSGTGR